MFRACEGRSTTTIRPWRLIRDLRKPGPESQARIRVCITTRAPPALAERARQSGEKAVAIAPNRPEGYLALGTYERLVAHDFNRALDQYEKGFRVAPGDAPLLRGKALAEEGLGRWDAAVEHFKQAERLDPRSVNNPSALGGALLFMRRYRDARTACDRGLALAPASLTLIEYKAMAFLGEGDLAGARAVFRAAYGTVDPSALVVYLANTYEVVWLSTMTSEGSYFA